MQKKIIGIVGYPLSGKNAVAAHLEREHQFLVVDTGALVRKYIAENRLGEATRNLMQDVANDLRKKHGGDYFVTEAIKLEEKRLALNGLRALGEVQTVKRMGGKIIACESHANIRYERAKKRQRASDLISFEEFVEHERAEISNPQLHKINLSKVIKNADFVIENNGTLEELTAQIDEILEIIEKNDSCYN